jgi:hypothetical protein
VKSYHYFKKLKNNISSKAYNIIKPVMMVHPTRIQFAMLLWWWWMTTTCIVANRDGTITQPLIHECFNHKLEGYHHPDSVSDIPGYNQPLPSAWYSGYLTYEFRTIHTHYTFIEAEDNEEGNKPIIYWSSKYCSNFFFFF